ncbi:tRNA U34 2-thiouridine synthase MnmA/TrmU, contains the PP-loop ATPase domain [Desulfurobacterium pacificum]|uniref:tRNA U34 2-thiouridine synthase MnmA/TrmU, contains the PP-loop ATPase domain n=1 Tax=Desulfurobacterium pacificum TaxID=240166 RepID=A0ABY1NFF7_9BACT|nr:DUF814 domain-containing protein [Desulfurobacterium pacificum]SMP07737.1 tRNA U34 2-thiouridine synthase MnmA/TrmU, contains the PP-loop ATPase domain [Desulfurobacterium pacificum]
MEGKAFLLFSGGLDSVLSALLLKKMGFEVVGIHLTCPFFEKNLESVKEIAKKIGIDLKVIPVGDDYLELVKNPPHGHGKNLNPCIDCKAYMLKKLKEIAGESGIIATGEVLGQRPMSQRLDAFRKIEKIAGLEGKVLRPLSGKLLPPTVYEKEGIVDRNKLLSLKGRSRKEHPKLLESFGFKVDDFPTPSGGCLLTEPSFAVKVKDLMDHNELNWRNVELLKIGRHFRIGNCKLIVGRNKVENEVLKEKARENELTTTVPDYPSPIGLLTCDNPDDETVKTAASIVARYSDAKNEKQVNVNVYKNGKLIKELVVAPCYECERFMVKR